MNRGLILIGGVGLGAGLMYALDPERGRRRRALLRDRVTHSMKVAGVAAGKTSRDIRNRSRGLIAEAESLFRPGQVSDGVLAARVRSRMGRVVSHPHAVEVLAQDGRVTLRGQILAGEADRLLRCASSVRGVSAVENQLEVHEQADGISALQGGRSRRGDRPELMQENWSPSSRLLVGVAGAALAFYGGRRRGVLGSVMSTVGMGMLTRGVTNLGGGRLIGVGGPRRGIDIQKTVNIDAPVERVFEFWSHPENFPSFMSHVREVRHLGGARYHWKVEGPAGVPVEWEAVVTKFVPKELLAWESVEGASVEQAGTTRLRQNTDGTTRLDVRMRYNPPAGAVGHTVAVLFGVDPKSEMDDDLMRMKTLLETGNRPADAAREEREAAAV